MLTYRLRHSRFGYEFASSREREMHFTEALLAGQQPGMMHPLTGEAFTPLAPGCIVTDKGHAGSAISGAIARMIA